MNDLSKERYGKVTGSQCYILFPKRANPKTYESYALELAVQKKLGYFEEKGSWQTDHGHTREPLAMDEYRKKYPFAYKPEFKNKGEIGGSADCLVEGENFGVDFKCPTSLIKWISYLDGIDHQQERQAQMYMWLYDKEEWHILAYLSETDKMNDSGDTYPIPSNKRFIVNIVKKDPSFNDEIIEKANKIIERRNVLIDLLEEKLM